MHNQIVELSFSETEDVNGGLGTFLAIGAIAAAAVALMELGERLHDAYCHH